MDIMAIASAPAGGATMTLNKGFASVANGGVGLNDFTLDNPLDILGCVMIATPRLATSGTCTTTHVSDTVKRVSTWLDNAVSGVPALSDLIPFDVIIVRP